MASAKVCEWRERHIYIILYIYIGREREGRCMPPNLSGESMKYHMESIQSQRKHIESYVEKEREAKREADNVAMGLSLELFQDLQNCLWPLSLWGWLWNSRAGFGALELRLCLWGWLWSWRWLWSSRQIPGFSIGLDWESKGTFFGWGPEILQNMFLMCFTGLGTKTCQSTVCSPFF